jgi:hypothetical protein
MPLPIIDRRAADTSAGTVLQSLSAARHINAAQLAAGEMLRLAFVRTDTGCLHRVHRALGDQGYLLVRDVIGQSMSLAKAAEVRGLRTRSEREYLGRRFRECLDCLAVEFGCATERAPMLERACAARACTHKSRSMSNGWSMSALPPKADIPPRRLDVCFGP